MKLRVAEVSYEGRIDEYEVVADSNIEARDLIARYLGENDWKSIRVRDTADDVCEPARVIKNSTLVNNLNAAIA